MREKYCPTEEEMKRYEVFMEVKMGKISLKYATELLGISYRHAIRRTFKK